MKKPLVLWILILTYGNLTNGVDVSMREFSPAAHSSLGETKREKSRNRGENGYPGRVGAREGFRRRQKKTDRRENVSPFEGKNEPPSFAVGTKAEWPAVATFLLHLLKDDHSFRSAFSTLIKTLAPESTTVDGARLFSDEVFKADSEKHEKMKKEGKDLAFLDYCRLSILQCDEDGSLETLDFDGLRSSNQLNQALPNGFSFYWESLTELKENLGRETSLRVIRIKNSILKSSNFSALAHHDVQSIRLENILFGKAEVVSRIKAKFSAAATPLLFEGFNRLESIVCSHCLGMSGVKVKSTTKGGVSLRGLDLSDSIFGRPSSLDIDIRRPRPSFAALLGDFQARAATSKSERISVLQNLDISNSGLQDLKYLRFNGQPVSSTLKSFLLGLLGASASVLNSLEVLECRGCSLSGDLAVLRSLTPALAELDLRDNSDLQEHLPSLLFGGGEEEEDFKSRRGHLLIEDNLRRLELTGVDGEFPQHKFTFTGAAVFPQLRYLNISHGSLTKFPLERASQVMPKIQVIDLSFNRLSRHQGERNSETSSSSFLKSLPKSLTVLDISHNDLSGWVDFTALPSGLQVLNCSFNKFSGRADFTKLSSEMRFLELESNEFSGKLDLTKIPVDLRKIWVKGNKWKRHLPRRAP